VLSRRAGGASIAFDDLIRRSPSVDLDAQGAGLDLPHLTYAPSYQPQFHARVRVVSDRADEILIRVQWDAAVRDENVARTYAVSLRLLAR
jgi:hypothetical protein